MIPRNVGRRLERMMRKAHRSKSMNTGEVKLRWREPSGIPSDYNRHIPSSAAAAQWIDFESDPHPVAFIHYVAPHTSGYQAHAQVQAGDIILDFLEEVSLDDKQELQFIIDGNTYVQKRGGDELAKSWDTRCGDTPITRTVLVTRVS